ncbi:MAG: hypothetical protein DLM58_14030 [Pseudonocardiales bacterium]|nr:MAG: hypothetical protein DLM58_14030 [Pseudonocardiales bacterium]
MLIKVSPPIIQEHVAAINATVAQLRDHQAAVTRIVTNPSLQMDGKNSAAIFEAHQTLNTQLDSHTASQEQLGRLHLQHCERMMSTDSQLCGMVE